MAPRAYRGTISIRIRTTFIAVILSTLTSRPRTRYDLCERRDDRRIKHEIGSHTFRRKASRHCNKIFAVPLHELLRGELVPSRNIIGTVRFIVGYQTPVFHWSRIARKSAIRCGNSLGSCGVLDFDWGLRIIIRRRWKTKEFRVHSPTVMCIN